MVTVATAKGTQTVQAAWCGKKWAATPALYDYRERAKAAHVVTHLRSGVAIRVSRDLTKASAIKIAKLLDRRRDPFPAVPFASIPVNVEPKTRELIVGTWERHAVECKP